MEVQRARKRSKRLSESSTLYEEDEPPKKRTKRTKSLAKDDGSSSNTKLTKRSGSKKLIVSLDFASNNQLSLGGVLLSQLSPMRIKGQRARRSISLASSNSNSVQDEIVVGRPEKMNFKNPKFCVSCWKQVW